MLLQILQNHATGKSKLDNLTDGKEFPELFGGQLKKGSGDLSKIMNSITGTGER